MAGNPSFPHRPLVPQEDLRRGSLLLLVIALGWGIYGMFSLVWGGYWRLGLINIIGVIISLALRRCVLHSGEQWRYDITCHLAAGLNVIGILLVTLLMGQSASFVPWYLALVPLAMAYVSTLRTTLIWSVLSSLAMLLPAWSEQFLHLTPEFSPDRYFETFARMVMVFLCAGIGFASRAASNRHSRELQTQKTVIRRQADALTETLAAEPDDMGAALPQARVLIVEDNPVTQLVAMEMVKRLGLHADVAGDGAEALAALEHQPYDLVLMDCQMPVMDGFEATRRLRDRLPPEQRLPVIAMTANAIRGDRERCLEAGMDDYLPKPVRLSELTAMLRRWLPVPGSTPV